jgi:hypothetical protein
MSKNPLILLLMGLLAIMAALSLWYSYQFGRHLVALGGLSYQRNQITRNLNVFQGLVNDTLEYSKRNPAIDPVLQAVNLKPKSGLPASSPTTATPPMPVRPAK